MYTYLTFILGTSNRFLVFFFLGARYNSNSFLYVTFYFFLIQQFPLSRILRSIIKNKNNSFQKKFIHIW